MNVIFRHFRKVASKFGLEFTFTDCTEVDNVTKAIKGNTKMIWVETPSNPTLKVIN